MKKMHSLEILRALGVLEVEQQANLQGSKASKVLKGLFSEQHCDCPIVGAGLAGAAVIERIREQDRNGSVAMMGTENHRHNSRRDDVPCLG